MGKAWLILNILWLKKLAKNVLAAAAQVKYIFAEGKVKALWFNLVYKRIMNIIHLSKMDLPELKNTETLTPQENLQKAQIRQVPRF